MSKINRTARAAERKSSILWGGLSFALPAAVMSTILAFCGIAPFGDATLIPEGSVAWFEGLTRLQGSLVSGEGVFYHLNVGMGRSFYTEFASGLCSPFLFSVLFFGSRRLAAACSFIAALRAGAAGLACWTMLCRCASKRAPLAFALACGYALSGFTFCAAYASSLADGIVFFPLVAAGIHRYVFQSRPLFLFVAASVFFLTSSRLVLMGMLLAAALYAAFYFRRGKARHRVYKGAMFAATMLCAALTATVLVLPMGVGEAMYENGAFADVKAADLPASLCFGGFGTLSEPGGYGLCLAGLLLMGALAFFCCRRISVGERAAVGAGMAAVLLASVLPPLGRLLLGFCAHDGQTVNVGFFWALLAVYAAARFFSESDGLQKWPTAVALGGFGLLAVASAVLRGGNLFALLAESGLAALSAVLFAQLSMNAKGERTRVSAAAALLLVFGAIHGGAVIGSIASPLRASALAENAARKADSEAHVAALYSGAQDSMRFFRRRALDGVSDGIDLRRSDNPGLTAFAGRLGIVADTACGGAENFTPLTDLLFGVGCRIEADGTAVLPDGADPSPALSVLVKDPFTLEAGNPFEVQNNLSLRWFGVSDLFVPVPASLVMRDSSCENEKYRWTFGNDTTEVHRYEMTLHTGDGLYVFCQEGDYGCAVGDDSRSHWRTCRSGGIYMLTEAAEDETVTVYFCADTRQGIPEPLFRVVSRDAAGALRRAAARRGTRYVSRRGSRLRFMLESRGASTAFTSIPYEYGWEITRNGEKVKPEVIFDGLIGIPLEDGSNSIEMTYRPPFFRTGLAVSCVMLLLGLYVVITTEHEATRRRKVHMAFRAVELGMTREGKAGEPTKE